jgi:hypothetical protein
MQNETYDALNPPAVKHLRCFVETLNPIFSLYLKGLARMA